MSKNNFKYSIIIATYNRCTFLTPLIESIINNNEEVRLGEVEILIIDNNSKDSTKYIIQEFLSRYSYIKYLFNPKQGLSNSRNTGIKYANGEVLIFLDDDVEVEVGWLHSLVKPLFTMKLVGVVGGKVLPYSTSTPEWLPKKFYWLVGVIDFGNLPKFVSYASGGNMAIKKSMLTSVGEFNEKLGRNGSLLLAGEEVEIQNKIKALGYKVYYVPRALVYHKIDEKLNSDYVLRFAHLEGVSANRIDQSSFKLKFTMKSIFGFLMLYFFLPLRLYLGASPKFEIRRKYFQGYLYGK